MNPQGHEMESSENSDQKASNYYPAPSLLGPKIFIYVVSIVTSLATVLFPVSCIAFIPWEELLMYVPLGAAVIAGVIAARFWLKSMTSSLRNHTRLINIPFLGILWGMVAGWLGAGFFWFMLFLVFSFFVMLPAGGDNFIHFFFLAVICTGIFGTLGGLGAGMICGIVWAIWTRPKQTTSPR